MKIFITILGFLSKCVTFTLFGQITIVENGYGNIMSFRKYGFVDLRTCSILMGKFHFYEV